MKRGRISRNRRAFCVSTLLVTVELSASRDLIAICGAPTSNGRIPSSTEVGIRSPGGFSLGERESCHYERFPLKRCGIVRLDPEARRKKQEMLDSGFRQNGET